MQRCDELLSVLFVISCSLTLSAQQITGSVRTISDPTGAVVDSANVTARQIETGFARAVATDRMGSYVIAELPVGHYQIQVEAQGFQKYLRDGISLDVNEMAIVNLQLPVGTKKEQIEVMADAQLIQNTATSLGSPVLEREIVDLPLNGRNFSQLGLLQTGVVPLTPGLAEAGGSLRNGQAYEVDGQRPESNNFLIDGAKNFNSVDAGFVLRPPVDAISEFRIISHNGDAEFGHSSGSTTNIVTRSGSNFFHGSAWEFLRNDRLDATNYFTQNVEPLKQNQFGGGLGGPIRRDRTFFFGYYEGFRNRQGETRTATVPSPLERQGDFSESGVTLLNLFAHRYPQPLLGDKVPFIDPISASLLRFIPLPNRGPNSFVSTQTLHDDSDQFGVRIDHYLSSVDVLNFRYMFNNSSVFSPLSVSGANVPGFPVGEDHRAQNFLAQQTHTFSPHMIGIFRFSFLRYKFLFAQHLNHTPPSSIGFQYQPSLGVAAGRPFIQINGYSSTGDPITGPRDTYQNSYDYSGALTWIRARHEIKFGGGYQRDQINALQGLRANSGGFAATLDSIGAQVYVLTSR